MDRWFSEQLETRGWSVLEKQFVEHLWVKKIWRIRSEWTPTDFEIYLSFNVDPQDSPLAFDHTTWVHAFKEAPLDWFHERIEREVESKEYGSSVSTTLSRNREKYATAFFDTLDTWRNAVRITQ